MDDDLRALCHTRHWGWTAPPTWTSCASPPFADVPCARRIEEALSAHQRGLRARQGHPTRDPDLLGEMHVAYERAVDRYQAFFHQCAPPSRTPEGYTLSYNLADALFWSEHYAEAAVTYERVRDWSWRDGRAEDVGAYGSFAGVRAAESRGRLLDASISRGELALPSPSPAPGSVPDVVAALVLARKVYLSRFPDDPEQVRTSFLLSNASLLERYGYWDEARVRYAQVLAAVPATDDFAREAAAGIVRMAMALGDSGEVARIAALVPSGS